MMRKSLLIAALAAIGTLALAACSSQQDQSQTAASSRPASVAVSKPADINDTAGWNKYLSQLVAQHLDGMTASQPYAYMVPPGDSDQAKAARDRQLEAVKDIVERGVVPGQLLAFGGAQSAQTADFLMTAFKGAKPGSFKDVIVLFIGDEADHHRVAAALKDTGADLRFVQI